MEHLVLGIGFQQDEYDIARQEWLKFSVDIEMAETVEEAVRKISEKEYMCAVFHSRTLEYQTYIEAMRKIVAIPVLVVSRQINPTQRAQAILQYILQSESKENNLLNRIEDIANVMTRSKQENKPLTIISEKDLYFCLEQRVVRVRGHLIDLTPKEFDLLHLLISHPSQVFSFELLFQQVWMDEYTLTSKKTLNNHMSSLNRKLKVEPDVPDFIINIHGIGYKYDLN